MIFNWLEDTARLRGPAHAVVEPDTYLSFRGMVHRASRRMRELEALGVGPGDAVGVMLGNVADYLVLVAALDGLGAVVVPLAPLCGGSELDVVQELVPLRAVIARPGAKVLGRSEKERAPASPAPTARSRLHGSLLSCTLYPRPEPMEESAAVVFVSAVGGGGYERVCRTREDLKAEAGSLAMALGISEGDRVSMALPFHHPFGFISAVTLTLGYGAQLQLDDNLSARSLLARLREGHTLVPVSRTLLRELSELPSAGPLAAEGARFLCVEGAVGAQLARSFQRIFKARPQGGYHRPATGLVALDRDGRSPATVGQPVAGVEVCILGRGGEHVAQGKRGRVLVRGPGIRGGQGPTPAEAGAAGAFFDTGERGLMDGKGRLRLLPRGDDLRCVEGLLVSLEEIRRVLLGHPCVEDAALELGGGSGSGQGSQLMARVVLRRQTTPERLSGFLAARLSLHKIPARIAVVDAL